MTDLHKAPTERSRQAVVLVHGIGEQRPMSTLRSFVDAFLEWGTYHSKPDKISNSYEMRRIKLRRVIKEGEGKDGEGTEAVNAQWRETDFYEYYWAHQMYGTVMAHIVAWLWRTMRCGARETWLGHLSRPEHRPRLRWMIPVSWVVAAIAILAMVLVVVSAVYRPETTAKLGFLAAAAIALWKLLVAPVARYTLVDVVGDAARYFDAAPKNVARRYDILRGGIEMLRKLHEDGDERAVAAGDKNEREVMYRYHRIVLIGHSLGSVIAYDILRHYWGEINGQIPIERADFADVENFQGGKERICSVDASPHTDATRFRDSQHNAWQALNASWMREPCVKKIDTLPARWLVTDLITLGSPLTYAPLLIGGIEGMEKKVELRELPTCPPDRSRHLNPGRFSVELGAEADRFKKYWILHHAALFAVTRWTNVFFTNDIVGGPLGPVFGNGVKDVEARPDSSVWWTGTAHVSYWNRRKSAAAPSFSEIERILKS